MPRTKQNTGGNGRTRKGSPDFVEPVHAEEGYWVTGADITKNRHTLRVFIKCRDRQVLDEYLDKLHITFELLPSQGTAVQQNNEAKKRASAQPQTALGPKAPGPDQEEPPTLDIYLRVKKAPKRKSLDTLNIKIDPPITPNKPHRYRFPVGSSAHVKVQAEGGEIKAVFTSRDGDHPALVKSEATGSVPFDAPFGSAFDFRLTLSAQNPSHYIIHGDIKRPDPLQPPEADDHLFLG
jgi:hypothetical protein